MSEWNEFLVRALRSPKTTNRWNLASQANEARAALLPAGDGAASVARVVELLRPPPEEWGQEQRMALRLMVALVGGDARDADAFAVRRALSDVGVVPLLVAGLERGGCIEVDALDDVLSVLMRLSFENGDGCGRSRDAIVAAGAVPALVGLLAPASSTPRIPQFAMVVLRELLLDERHLDVVVDAGAVAPIVALTGPSETVNTRRIALAAAGTIAMHRAKVVAEVGGLPLALAMLVSVPRQSAGAERVLRALAGDHGNRDAMKHVMSALVDALEER